VGSSARGRDELASTKAVTGTNDSGGRTEAAMDGREVAAGKCDRPTDVRTDLVLRPEERPRLLRTKAAASGNGACSILPAAER
jgi:hypothetical protein